jgi:ribosomal protein L7/L12
MDNDFRTVAMVLREYIPNTYDLLSATDAVLANLTTTSVVDPTDHDGLVRLALNTPEILNAMRETKRIHAIKALRLRTGCSLLQGKNAVEDPAVHFYYGRA